MAADTISITPGSGADVAVDDCGASGEAQIVKLAISTDGAVTRIPADATNGLDVDVTRLPADPFGTNADAADKDGSIAAKLRFVANTGIPVTSLPALPAGTNNIGQVDPRGNVAHDAADSGNPVKVGARAAATLSDDTMVANADRTDLISDLDGALITRPQIPFGDALVQRTTNTDGSEQALSTFGATASAKNVIAWVVLCNSSATAITVNFLDGSGGTIFLTLPVPATGGVVFTPPIPIRQPTANTGLYYDGSAAVTTLTVSIGGYKTKV